MRARLIFLSLAIASCAHGQYSYEFGPSPDPVNPDPAHWSQNGIWDGFDLSNNQGGTIGFGLLSAESFIYVPQITSGANGNDYEVKSTITSGGAAVIHYLRASSGALDSPNGSSGSYTSVTFAGQQMTVNQCAGGGCSQLGSTTVGTFTGNSITLRTVIWNTNLLVYVNNSLVWSQQVPLTYGQPGIGGWGDPNNSNYAGFINVQVGHRDAVSPGTPIQTGLKSSIVPNSVSLAWQGVADDTYGVGVYGYNVSRSDVGPVGFSLGAEFGDGAVSAGTSYSYSVAAVDYHGNVGTATTWTVTTPPAGSVDPRREGVYVTGSYWGGGGEQIDTLSGNVNYTMPLVKPMARPGWTVPITLAYNSQNWRQDNGTNWELGADVGYGFGWQMQIGSITPYYAGFGNGVHHYVFTDSTGAQYRLDLNSGNVWSSSQGIYVWFDANANILHFKNGTFWTMGSVSGGQEQDAGTMYPTVIEDASGNYIVFNYQASPTVPFSTSNSSARLATIVDARAAFYNYCNCVATYWFTYTTLSGDSFPHLTAVGNYIGTAESYSGFSYASVAVQPAFGVDTSYNGVTTRQLDTITVPAAGAYTFSYDTASGSRGGASELTQVTFPWGGHLGWNYVNATYSGSRVLREIGTRYLAADAAGVTVWSYPFSHSDSGSAIQTVHTDTTLADASGTGAKTWKFLTDGSNTATAWRVGLISQFLQSASSSGTVITQDTYSWLQGSGNPYISQKVSVKDPNGSNPQSATSTQAIDVYGNVTQSVVFPYNATGTPLETFNNTYLTSSPYIAVYIRDRLSLSTVTTASGTYNLVQNYYDQMSGYDLFTGLGCYSGYSYGNFGLWAGFMNGFANNEPIAGLVSASVTPARSTCSNYFGGVANHTARSDGPPITSSLNSSTGFSAPSAITAGSETVSLGYNSWLGITQTTGTNGEQMYMTYDSYGRPISGTSPYGTYGTPTVTYGYVNKGSYYYGPSGQTVATSAFQVSLGPNGFTRTTLDGLGRPIRVERGTSANLNFDWTIQSVVDTTYAACACSPLGKIQSVSQPYAPGSTPTWTTYTYDGIGRTLTVRQPDGASTTTYSYSGNQTTVTDPAGKWKQFTNDVLGNLVTVTEPN